MAELTVAVNDDDLERVLEAMCTYWGWTPDQGDRQEFVRQILVAFLRSNTLSYERTRNDEEALAASRPVDPIGIT